MLVVITYDVNTETPEGKKRLRQVAKQCVNHGQRVQNSVFECSLNAAEFRLLEATLVNIIDETKDSLRFYQMSSSDRKRIKKYGIKTGYDEQGFLSV